MKLSKIIGATIAFSSWMAITAFAGTWQMGDGANQGKWWYDNGNGAHTSSGWQWIDGNGDGIAESYYFDENGWLLVSTTTPDGYIVNANGEWVQNGVIQTRMVNADVAPISENDFIVSGDNSVTRSNADNSIITNWVRTGYVNMPITYHTFISGDSLQTARGISFGDTKDEVMAKYGNAAFEVFHSDTDKIYQVVVSYGSADAPVIAASASVMEYFMSPYGIRFYFNQQEQLSGIVFFRDTTRNGMESSNVLDEGYYYYYTTDIYDNDSQSMIHKGEVFCSGSQDDSPYLETDRYPFGLVADPVYSIRIGKVTDSTFEAYYEEYLEYAQYFNENSARSVTYYKDGDKWRAVGSENEPDYYWVVENNGTFLLYDGYDRLDSETGEVIGHYTEIRTYKKYGE